MAARLDNFNFDPRFKLAASDATVLLAMQNFCFDNLKAIFEKIIANKKAQDQHKENNELMDYMILVSIVMEEFQLRINQNFYRNKELEENEFLQQQIQEGEKRIDELNRLFSEANTIQFTSHQIRETEYKTKNAQLEKELKELNETLRNALLNVSVKKSRLFQTNQLVENTFNTILNNISSASAPVEFEVHGIKLKITQEESKNAIKNELKQDFDNGTFTLENARPKVKNAFIKLGMEKLTQNNIEHTFDAVAKVDQMAENKTNDFMEHMQRDENIDKLNTLVENRELFKSEVKEAEEWKNTCEDNKIAKEAELVALRQEYDDVIPPIPQAVLATADELENITEEDVDIDDPFAQNEIQNPNDDEFPAPPGEPDDNNYPNEPPPPFPDNRASEASWKQANAFPEPSAPEEQVDFPAPSAPPEEILPIPMVAPPIYPGNDRDMKEEVKPEISENKIEEKSDPVQLQKNESKNEIKPTLFELKEHKTSSTTGIIGMLGGSAAGIKESLNKPIAPTQPTENKGPIVKNNNNDLQDKPQNENEDPQNKGPNRRR